MARRMEALRGVAGEVGREEEEGMGAEEVGRERVRGEREAMVVLVVFEL
jgi:hypothetical protein